MSDLLPIAILCPGPSLASHWDDSTATRAQYFGVYAINHAALTYHSDVAVCCDDPMQLAIERAGKAAFIRTRSTLPLYERKCHMLEEQCIDNNGQACRYTLPCAVDAVWADRPLHLIGFDASIDSTHPLARWQGELAWLAYALKNRSWQITGNIRTDWLQWLSNPQKPLPR